MIKVAISYRVLQEWRVPVFERLSKTPGLSIKVFYGDDFEGTKIKSFKGQINFPAHKLSTKKICLSTSNGNAYIPFTPSIYSELKKFSPDVIITEGASNFINNLICFYYAKRYNKKIIQWGLGEIDGRKKSLQRKILDILFTHIERKSDAAIAYSSYGSKYYEKIGLAPEKITTAVNVVDTEARTAEFLEYCENNNLPLPSPLPSDFNILFVGSLSENKGIDKLIHAYAKILQSSPPPRISLTIVGDGKDRVNLESLANELGILDRIEFAGHVSKGIGKYFYKASIFILPGLGGLAVSDSLVHGVPVICSIGDGCEKDLIQNEVNGIIIKDLTQNAIANTILSMYSNPEKTASMRRSAQAFCNGDMNINNYVSRIEEAIKKCTK